jgi:hypothetical protein
VVAAPNAIRDENSAPGRRQHFCRPSDPKRGTARNSQLPRTETMRAASASVENP